MRLKGSVTLGLAAVISLAALAQATHNDTSVPRNRETSNWTYMTEAEYKADPRSKIARKYQEAYYASGKEKEGLESIKKLFELEPGETGRKIPVSCIVKINSLRGGMGYYQAPLVNLNLNQRMQYGLKHFSITVDGIGGTEKARERMLHPSAFEIEEVDAFQFTKVALVDDLVHLKIQAAGIHGHSISFTTQQSEDPSYDYECVTITEHSLDKPAVVHSPKELAEREKKKKTVSASATCNHRKVSCSVETYPSWKFKNIFNTLVHKCQLLCNEYETFKNFQLH